MTIERETTMASDTYTDTHVTFADLCRAIAEQRIPHTLRDEHYCISARDLRLLAEGQGCGEEHTGADLWLDLLSTPDPCAANLSEMSSPS